MLKVIRKTLKKTNEKTGEEKRIETLYNKGLKTGENFNCGSWFGIDKQLPWLVAVGDNVTISCDVRIITHDYSTNHTKTGTKIGLVKIGNNCFIGAGVIILPGVMIGDNVIIGAGSVISKNIPSNSVVVGNPARVIMTYDEWAEKNRQRKESHHYFNEMPWQEWLNADEEHRDKMIEILENTGGYGFF